ncbi:hypothetical protein AMAG_20630 [Allomyces macrogynus ATCC 38327]|uniref:Peptidase S8/S53 domain-containing protein n=1 Tax=Allomyces macrogynus (strain ATCC 38327) TaxID=578462 RepID=A0A0L0TDC3_ALLM3|nr:hypothetical protein AMAG_20630 [Allomyces macrogynus ATCC 38327]|eukprot:KNE72903.1 hypothetical protein AMAG_20630 [Allomyces macrogynus ATCC 38327]
MTAMPAAAAPLLLLLVLAALIVTAASDSLPPPQRWIVALKPDTAVADLLARLAPLGLALQQHPQSSIISIPPAWRAAVIEPVPQAVAAVEHTAVSLSTALSAVAFRVEEDKVINVAAPFGVGAAPPPNACVSTELNPVNWGLDRIDQPTLPLNSEYAYPCLPETKSASIVHYVLDTGIYLEHNEFEGRARWGTNVVANSTDTDENGHGTFVSGIIGGKTYGVYKAAQLVAVKALNAAGSGTISDVLRGLDWIAAQGTGGGAAIINMSVGGLFNSILNEAVERIIALGFTVVAAAGNFAIDACLVSPASARGSITVGATNITDELAYYSDTGPCIDLLAPGTGITSAFIGSPDASTTRSGTSFSAPHVSGLLGLYAATTGKTSTADLRAELRARAVKDVIKIPVTATRTPNLLAQVWGP